MIKLNKCNVYIIHVFFSIPRFFQILRAMKSSYPRWKPGTLGAQRWRRSSQSSKKTWSRWVRKLDNVDEKMFPQRSGQKMLMNKMLLKKSGQKWSKFATCLARRKRWWQRETRSWKKKTRFPTLCFCPPGSLLAFQFDLLKKRTLFYERFTQWCPSCLHYTVFLPSRTPAGISILSEWWQINRWWKYCFHFVCITLKFLNILLISAVLCPLAEWVALSFLVWSFVCLSRYGNIRPNLHFFQYIQA